MSSGIVKWFNSKNRYGFITPDDGGKDIFVHISEIEKVGLTFLKEGQELEYEVTENNGKMNAVDLVLK